jgi:uncharacterized delta-60 repeat protein
MTQPDAGDTDFYAVKLLNNGSLDTSFGTNGKTVIGDGNNQFIYSMRAAADGSCVLIGDDQPTYDNYNMYAVKLTANGQLDNNFGTGGIFTFGDEYVYEHGYSVENVPGGGYILAGFSEINSGDAYLVKLTANGQLDNSFGTGGIVAIGEEYVEGGGQSYENAYSIRRTSDNGYIMVGYTDSVPNGGIYVVKTDSAGNKQ